MNISYKWLKDYVDFDLTPQEVCDALTSVGLEVDALEEVQGVKGGLKGLYVGKVLTCEPHPNSDHLHITTVDIGHDSPSQIPFFLQAGDAFNVSSIPSSQFII